MKKVSFLTLVLAGIVAVMSSCSMLENVNPFNSSSDSASLDLMFMATSGDSTANGPGGHHGPGPGGHHGPGGMDSTGHQPDSTHHKITEIDVTSLPSTITAYVTTNYAGATIDAAGTLEDGSYVMKITKADGTTAGLHFDATGNFLDERTPKAKPTEIDITTLPTAITSYITANYSGATIEHAIMHDDGTYGVMILQADSTKVGLGFDANGNFVAVMQPKGKGQKKGHNKG